MREALGTTNVLQVHELGASINVPLEYLVTSYRAVVGHLEVSQLPEWIFERTFAFTFLRDPIDRVISNYYFYRNVAHDRQVTEMATAQRLGLKGLLEQCDRSRPSVWSNWQTFVLSGLRHEQYASEPILEPAKRNLQRMDFVGFYEELNNDVNRLIKTCGWSEGLSLSTANKTPAKRYR